MPDPSSLAAQFLSHLPPALRSWLGPHLAERLQPLLVAAAAAWPEFTVPPQELASFVAQRLPAQAPDLKIEQLLSPELYLVCACLGGNKHALVCFERQYLSPLDRALAHMKLGAKLQDVKQLVRQLLFVARPGTAPKLAAYTGRGKLAAWLRVIAVREAIDLLDKERPEILRDPAQVAALPVADDDPELGYMKRTYRAAFKEAFAQALLSLSPREQNLLRQQVLDGLTVTELGALYQVHHATAARWLVEARKELVQRTRKELKTRLRLTSSECDSILRLADSHLTLSLSRLLGRAPAPESKIS